ncbi:CoA transferase [Mycolicibacterium sp. BiH015]|uniref:CoA transferase n=1 Tax=Mycolicibacterium sp. BiH015 TaxID=3018808 RepID=UPI0022E1C414|nr:CoA transferase [Mycolicibacterium sp. BiH015]MDA2892461.1 CoA transferase [Mycolicibacterium sp. BiH015]
MSSVRVPAAVLARARENAQAIASLAGVDIDADETIGGRAALLGLPPAGRISSGGATRLMDGPGGWCALTLSRPDDLAAVPALIEHDAMPDTPWDAIEYRVRDLGVAAFAERARLLGLPVGVLGESVSAPTTVSSAGERGAPIPAQDLLVVDLSSMWAGPLCGRVLADAGAIVVKVESAQRPDGTRNGPVEFFDWINAGKLSYEADFEIPGLIRRLLTAADVVIESSRPSALQRRGLGPADVAARPGRTWIRITGHGTTGERADWVAFGDDAAVSGGLVVGTAEAPQFCGDAVADPLTGICAARAVLESRARGGGELIEVSMSAVAAEYAQLVADGESDCTAVPSPAVPAAPLGADNNLVDRMVAERLAA